MKRKTLATLMIITAMTTLPVATGSSLIETMTSFFVSCTSSGQLCDPPFSLQIQTGGALEIQYFVSSGHCSSVRLHIFLDGNAVLMTGFLGWFGATGDFASLPLDTGVLNLGPVSSGTHLLQLQAEGQVGGCNQGYLASWAGMLKLLTSSPAITVHVDIKPGSDPNSINPRSMGTIPVAILSSTNFDAPGQVDTSTLTFGRTGDENSLAFCSPSPEDVNGDGLLDLVCHFNTGMTGFGTGDAEGILRGRLTDSTPVEGSDSVRILAGGGGRASSI